MKIIKYFGKFFDQPRLVNNLTNEKTGKILEKAKSNVLSIKEIKQLSESLKTADGKALFKELIPEPENITSNDIFQKLADFLYTV